MAEHPHVPAAFINAIREEGTKAEAIDWLQKTWNERCALSARVAQLEEALGAIEQYVAAERDRYYGLIDAGKGEHGKEGYVRDATWSTWCAKHSLAEAILYVIETTRRRALQEQGGGER